jgi:hypothetical protein
MWNILIYLGTIIVGFVALVWFYLKSTAGKITYTKINDKERKLTVEVNNHYQFVLNFELNDVCQFVCWFFFFKIWISSKKSLKTVQKSTGCT